MDQQDQWPGRTPLPSWAWPLAAGLVALALYLPARSASLDDFDSYSFVLALRHFDLALQQPQPPGFPVYVGLGRLFNLAFPDPRAALTTLSAASGAAAVAAVVWLGQMAFRRPTGSKAGAGWWAHTAPDAAALLTGLLFAVLPIQWLTAGKALSDAPGLAASLGVLALVWAGRRDGRLFAAGAALLGLSLGIRPQANPPALLLLSWAAWEKARARAWQPLALGASAGLAGVLTWLIPVTASTGGIGPYRAILAAHGQHVWRSDSLFTAGLVTGVTLRARTLDFLQTLLLPLIGVDVYAPLDTGEVAQVAALVMFVVGGAALADWRRGETRLLAVWALAVLVPYYLLESLNRPRLALPLLPPLVLLAAGGWLRPRRGQAGRWDAPSTARWAVVGLATAAMLIEGAPLARTLATVPAPPAQAAAHIRQTYPPGETLVAAAGSFRAAQVELPGYRLLYRYQWDDAAAREATASSRYAAIAILDREIFGDVIESLDGGGRYVPIADLTFTRDRRVHLQHDQVRLQLLVPADSLGPADLELPEGGLIDIGGADDGRYLGQGWFRAEEVGGASARWAGDGTTSELRVTLPPASGHMVTFRAAAIPPGQTVEVHVNGQVAARLALAQDWREYRFEIEPGLLEAGQIAVVELAHGQAVSAYDQTGGSSPDTRPLSAAYDWIRFEPR